MRDEAADGPTLEEVRAFVHLARELHFGRAASGLGVARSSLSETIRRLEAKLGTVLFERTSRRVTLTRAGARLLPRARGVVSGVAGLRAAAPSASRGTGGVLRIGMEANGFAELTRPILATFRLLHPGVTPVLREFDGIGQSFLDRHLDVALTKSPVLDDRLEVIEMAREDRGLLVDADHPRAGTADGSIADFLDDPFVALAPEYRAYWMADEHRGGERPRIGGEAFTLLEVLHSVTHLGLVTTAGRSIPLSYPVPGMAFAAVRDLSPVVLGVAVRAGDERPVVADFLDVVREAVHGWEGPAGPASVGAADQSSLVGSR